MNSRSDLSSFEAMRPEERILLEQRLLGKRKAGALPTTIPRRKSSGPCALSFAQSRLWLVEQINPVPGNYNISQAYRIRGPLNIEALRAALDALLARHDVLRTRLVMHDGAPQQFVAPHQPFALKYLDLRQCDDGAREHALGEFVQGLARGAFDFSADNMLRAGLAQLRGQECVLVIALHHVAADGWSLGVLDRELERFYTAFDRGRPAELPPLPLQYSDYSEWQRDTLTGAVLDAQLTFWRRQLAGLPSLELPTDRARPAQLSYRGDRERFTVPAELVSTLKDRARDRNATLYMALLAAFQVLLMRYSGHEDFAVGSPIAGRNRTEIEGLIGLFVNTLVMRGDLSGNPAFSELLTRTRERAVDAYAYQDLPFEKLVEELKPERNLSRNPLFQVMFTLQNTREAELRLPGLEITRLPLQGDTAKFDLSLALTKANGQLEGVFEYSTDLFDASTIRRMAAHFRQLLNGIVADPECRIGELPLLTDAERHQLLVEWNATAVDYPRNQCIHQLFEQQVERTPEAVAVVFGEQQLTYRELNTRANRLAHHLRSLGVGPEVLVGLCVERSLELVVGLLGILKAGGAYVPLDPGYPAQRLAFMLEDTQAPVLLTQERLLGQLPPHAGQTLCLDRDWPTVAAQPATDPRCTTSAANLAYVIYTSGSTGQPKGVMIEHRALVNHMEWMRRTFDFDHGDSVLQKTPISFDAATWEFFVPLLVGGRLVMASPDAHRDPLQIIGALREHRVTTVQLVPSLFRLLTQEPKLAACATLSRLFCGGESLPGDAVQRFFERSSARLYNLYGPTETCIDAVWWECNRNDARATVPIGRPIANTLVYILDVHRQPVPAGVVGELYIGGDGLARGYWKRPGLTAERFVPDSYALRPGAKMYRTGDRARYLSDGTIEFLGRLDQQVKLRGFRIEPGEIEAALARHAEVREALVLLREDVPGDPRLVAYVVTQSEAISLADLRASLKQFLPDHMLPSAFVFMDALPLAPNGKVARESLPIPGSESLVANDWFVPPHDAIEVQLVRIWEGLLGRYPVGVTDDFFDLGGHSLLAMQVIDRVNQLFGRDLPIDVLWHGGRTIESLATILRDRSRESEPIWSRAVPIRPGGLRRPLFCAPVVGGHLFFYDNLARNLDPDQPVYGLPAQGIDGRQPPHATIESMATHAIRLMREVQPTGPYALLGYCSGGVVAFEMARQLEAQGESASLLALVDSWAPGSSLRSWGNLLFPVARSRNWRLLQERIYQLVLHPFGLVRLRRFAKVGEAHRWALWSYRPKHLAGRVVLVRPSGSRHSPNPALGWDRFVGGGVEVRVLSGHHGDLVKGPGAARLAEELVKWLA